MSERVARRPRMKRLCAGTVAALVCGSIVAAAQSPDAAALLASSRVAFGGDAALDAVHSFVVAGSLDTGHGSISVTVTWVRPDKFLTVTKTTVGYGNQETTYYGFNQNLLIDQTYGPAPTQYTTVLRPVPTAPASLADAERLAQAKLAATRHQLLALSLSLFARSVDLPLPDFSLTGRETLPTGPADRLEAIVEGHPIDLWLDAVSHRVERLAGLPAPVRQTAGYATIAYAQTDPRTDASVTVPRDPATGERILDPAVMPPPTELNMFVTVKRPVSGPATPSSVYLEVSEYQYTRGLCWPHVFTTVVNGRAIGTLKLDTFAVNAKVSDKVFAVK